VGIPSLRTLPALRAVCLAAVLAAAASAFAASASAAAAGEPAPPARIEARSSDLLAVGLLRGDRLTIHISRLIDNAPVRDAAVSILLRGSAHPATAEADGSFTLQTPELAVPGAATVEIQVMRSAARETLKGTLEVAAPAEQSEDKNSARQLWWWVLNFAVCIGFLWLISRRRKSGST
jgi:membrane fusion protein, heavy metal efflux system